MTTDKTLHRISVIIPVHNGLATLDACLQAVTSSAYEDWECILVDDSSTDNTVEQASQYPVKVLQLTGGPYGPAYARNQGAQAATGEILFFVDADVVIHPDTLSKLADSYQRYPEADAIFGSYDERPSDGTFLSQYKNLLHHFVHQQAQPEASTFWSGCGAVRREVFLKVGGFDAQRYPRPSIEDIELGRRMITAGCQIRLDKDLQVTHLKRWSLAGLVKTDILYRALPWTLLILHDRSIPNDLNLRLSQRVSSLLLLAMLLLLGLFSFQNNVLLLSLVTGLFLLLVSCWSWVDSAPAFEMSQTVERPTFFLIGTIGFLALLNNQPDLLAPFVPLLPLLLIGRLLSRWHGRARRVLFVAMMLAVGAEFALLFASYSLLLVIPLLALVLLILALNYPLYLFFARKRGLVFALAALPLQLFYYLYSLITFAIGGSIHLWNTKKL